MPGPAPKHPSARARQNKAATKATLVAHSAKIPPVPEGVDWHPEAIHWWNDVWASPMSPEWDESDVHNVTLCAMLINDVWRAETTKERRDAMAEFRLQRKDLGLSPYDRRRLEWTIETAKDATAKGQSKREKAKPATKPAGEDPRSGLYAV